MKHRCFLAAAVGAAGLMIACGTPGPGPDGLRDSFVRQLAANRFVTDVQRDGDDITFSGPGADRDESSWRVHIDSVAIEAQDDPSAPYKGTVTSSWYADGQPVRPSGVESNLPVELMANGLSQECWALWDAATEEWGWE